MYNGECHMNLLRKMQASFAWDWGLAAPSMGIWKDASIDVYDSIIIRDVTYKLIDGAIDAEDIDEDIWSLKIFVHMEAGVKEAEFDGVMTSEFV
jgi:beta-mannosidase